MRIHLGPLLALAVMAGPAHATIDAKHNAVAFGQGVTGLSSVSFNAIPVGIAPTTLQLGDVSVVLTTAGGAPIEAPGSLNLDFTTNYLSTGVKDDDNHVVITFPPGSKAGGMLLLSFNPVTLTAQTSTGEQRTETFTSSSVSFLGFRSQDGIGTITVSSPNDFNGVPIVNIGDISYASGLASVAVAATTLPAAGWPALTLLLFGLATMAGSAFHHRRMTVTSRAIGYRPRT
jgi:hypothetical protein